MKQPRTLSRRDLFSFLFQPSKVRSTRPASPVPEPAPPQPAVPKQAVIQGRFCLAYKNLACSVCSERCPEPGAIQIRDGIPQIVPLHCTACGVCRQVCPAPRNAILIVARASSPTTSPGVPPSVHSNAGTPSEFAAVTNYRAASQ